MFKDCKALTELDLSSFDTVKVYHTKMMFYNCPLLKTIYVSDKWDMEYINYSDNMFAGDDGCCYTGGNGTVYDAESSWFAAGLDGSNCFHKFDGQIDWENVEKIVAIIDRL